MSRTRILAPKGTAPPMIPRTANEWAHFLKKAIDRAEATGHPSLAGLRLAMIEGRAEKVLRRLSLVTEADLDREMPLSS